MRSRWTLNRRPMTTRRAVAFGALSAAAGLGVRSTPGRAQSLEAVVVGTDEAPIREAAEPMATVRTRVPLGERVTITGEAVGGYVPVEVGDAVGFAPELYLATDPAHVPFLELGQPGCQRVALFFNIGVGFEPDEGILDTLRAEEVPATMFLMGWWADERPSIIERMVEEGYPIGTHGYDAILLPDADDATVIHDLEDSVTAIEQATGQPIDRIFTPYAAAIDERVRALIAFEGFLPVGWTVSAVDYAADATPEAVWDNVVPHVEDGAMVEFHLDAPASAASTGVALPWIIESLRERGYRFVTVPEMAEACPEPGD